MGTELTTFKDRPPLSDKYRSFFAENKNIQDRETVPTLSIEGKNFHIVLNGERTTITKNDADGDPVPVTTLKVVVLDQNPVRGRAYYGSTYDPDKPAMPTCWSDDCVAPSPHVKADAKQAANCAACPMSVKGSRKTDTGKESTACQQHQFVAVVPAFNMSFEPLRMKLPITSIWDGQNKENDAAGWFAFKNYTDFLRAHGVDHTALLVTKMKFDSGAAYPKLLFARDKFLADEELDVLVPIIQSQKVKDLISASWTPNGRDGVHQAAISGPEDNAAAAAAKDVTPPKSLEEKAAITQATLDRAAADKAASEAAEKAAKEAAKIAAEKAAKKAAKIAAAKAAEEAAAAAEAAAEDDNDDGEVNLPGTAAAAPTQAVAGARAGAPKAKATPVAASAAGKPATAAATAAVPAGLDALIGAWGDDD